LTRSPAIPYPAATIDPDWAATIHGCILDMDGVLYRGNTIIPEVPAFIDALTTAGIPYAMATNNSTNTPLQYVEKLAAMGIDVPEHTVVTSGVATATLLKSKYARGTTIYVVGMAALEEALFADGYFVPAGVDAQVVVSGANFELRYEHLKTACLAIRAGAAYVATNADKTFPTEIGLIPGAGAIVAALSAATGVDPLVVGKPSPAMIESCLTILGVEARNALMIGDRLDTDILAGQRAGTPTLLVLTGVSTLQDVADQGVTPDVIIETLDPLTKAIAGRTDGWTVTR
jgi:4-nitrophenyl phosphatase